MKIIKCIAEKVEDELQDAEAYVKLAQKWKKEQPETADVFYELSEEELGHMEKLHEEVVRLIAEYREENGEPPEGMKMLYDYLHEKYMEKATKIRVMQGMYKA